MAIQVSSTAHAAATVYVTRIGDEGPIQFLQSPQGCVVERVDIQEGELGWLFLLDYGLDAGSTALSCISFGAIEPPATSDGPAVPVLFHIDDRVKGLVLLAPDGECGWRIASPSFHAMFWNFQANQSELYPVELGVLPTT